MSKFPEINIAPVYEIDLKVLGQTIKYTPYNIAQEKAILTALESKNSKDIINNYAEVLKGCLKDEINIETLSVVDFLNLIIAIRCKSTDEILSLQRKSCKKCEKPYDFEVDLMKNMIYTNEDKKKDVVKIKENLTVEIKPLRFGFLKILENIKDEIDTLTYTAAFSITKVIYNETIYKNKKPEELTEKMLVNFSKKDLKKIFDAAKDLISLKLEIKSTCPECENEEVDEVRDFLKFVS